VAVYDADGEKVGTVSDWQDMRNYLIVHQGRLFGHDTYVPHTAIKYSDMNGVHLRLRHGDLTSIKQAPLSEHALSISVALPILAPDLPILAPDMGVAAVAAMAFADDTTSHPVPTSSSSADSAVEAVHETTVQAAPLSAGRQTRRLWRRRHR
jgi:hypothetical protein